MAKRGRKGKYDTHVKPRLKDIENWCRVGLIEKEMSKRLGISLGYFQECKKKHDELNDTLKQGKQEADYRVENALYNRAIGYEYIETKTIVDNAGKTIREEKTTKQLAPDVTAQIFWLKNRKSLDWKDKHEHSIPEDIKITVTLVDNDK